MNEGPQILLVSRDPSLLQSRKLILGTYFQVEALGRVAEAEARIARQHLSLIVLCYTLREDETNQLLERVKQLHAPTKILLLSPFGNQSSSDPDKQVFAMDRGPYELVKKVAEMLSVDLKERSSKKVAAPVLPLQIKGKPSSCAM